MNWFKKYFYIIAVIIVAVGAMVSLAKYNDPAWYIYALVLVFAAAFIWAGWKQTKKG